METLKAIQEHQKRCNNLRKSLKSGPWDNEPDRVEFTHAGLTCLLLRNSGLGNWCGYVGLPPGHPAYGKKYDEVPVSVHGGLTFANECHDHICHVPDKDEPDHLYWLGFDCAHAGDFIPTSDSLLKRYPISGETYKGVKYVKKETMRLADQLACLTIT